MSLALSLVIITRNAALELPMCLQSAPFADEILIVDTGSTDATLQIAQEKGARIEQTPWLGFGPTKRYAVNQARHDWVLCLDADERISPQLAQAIQQKMHSPQAYAYRMARSNYFLGRYLKHGEGYPDWSLRLFHRQYAQWSEDLVHEKVLTQTAVATLSGDLLHHSAESLRQYMDKQNRYTTIQAEQLFTENNHLGKKVGWTKIVLSPFLRFIKFYFLRQGFLDGMPGLIHILIGCFNSMMKYAKCYALQISSIKKLS